MQYLRTLLPERRTIVFYETPHRIADSMDDLIAAAKAEGELTTIALPHDWCGYGGLIEGFKAKFLR